MNRTFSRSSRSRRTAAGTLVLTFLLAGGGQAFGAVGCPSHEKRHATVAGATSSSDHLPVATEVIPPAVEHHSETHARVSPSHPGPTGAHAPAKHQGHPCGCMGACCQAAAVEPGGFQHHARRLARELPLVASPPDTPLRALADPAYLLPFSTAPPPSS